MTSTLETATIRDPRAVAAYRRALRALNAAGAPFLVGGAFALQRYTGVVRDTKDLDLFVRRSDLDQVLGVLAEAGFRTEITYPHWLAKAYRAEFFVDLIFSSDNRAAPVDDLWFEHAVEDVVMGVPVLLCPVEETVWSKAFVLERERYDGADVAHLFRSCAAGLDWRRLLDRFGDNWRVLMSHLVLFGFAYPHERQAVPGWVTRELVARLCGEIGVVPSGDPVCQGRIMSRAQYRVDVEDWGMKDPIPSGDHENREE